MTCNVWDRVTLNAGGSTPFVRLRFQPAGNPEPAGAVNKFVSVCVSSRTEITSAPRRNDRRRDVRTLWAGAAAARCGSARSSWGADSADGTGSRAVDARVTAYRR